MRVGVLGGTFDPVHLGHLIIAQEARDKLALDKVMFIPAGQPWLKEDTDISPAPKRLEMLELALQSNETLCVDTQELDRPGSSYTVDTISQMRERLGPRTDIYFIIGMDALEELNRWKNPEQLAQLCYFAAMKRLGHTRLDLKELEKAVPGISERVCFMDNPQVDISSSDIRRRVREALPISYLVPKEVEAYISENGLYRA